MLDLFKATPKLEIFENVLGALWITFWIKFWFPSFVIDKTLTSEFACSVTNSINRFELVWFKQISQTFRFTLLTNLLLELFELMIW